MSADFKGQYILIIAERGPEALETLSGCVGFLLSSERRNDGRGWHRSCSTGRGFSAARMSLMVLLHFQLFGGCRLKAPSAPRAQTTVGNTANARGTPAVTSAEPLTPGSPTKPSKHVQEETRLWSVLTCHHRSKRLLRIERAFQPARLQVLSIQPEYRFLRINTYALSWHGCREKLRRTVLLPTEVKVW